MNPSTIRSFVRRQGRITDGQKYALTHYWSQYGIDLNDSIIFDEVFLRKAPVLLEIGFGMGESIAQLAEENPTWNFIGIDVHRPGIGALLAMIHERKLNNIRLIEGDAINVFKQITSNSIDIIQILFPDPWPKKRHHKRRLIQASFLNLILPKLKTDGFLSIATDWEDYYHHIQTVLHHYPILRPLELNTLKHPVLINRPQTKFERRGLKQGHKIFEIILKKFGS